MTARSTARDLAIDAVALAKEHADRADAAQAESARLRATVAHIQAELDRFKPQPMSQLCRDGKHNGTGDFRCINCWCLCHRGELNGERRAIHIAGLDDAITLRFERAHAYCLACGEAAEGMCPEHTGDLAAAERYRAERDRLEAGR